MKYLRTTPCNQCPFRRASCAGWLGDSTPEEFIEVTLADHAMPCHATVDYEDPDWKEKMADLDSKVQHCAGARIFFANQCKMPKNPVYLMARHFGWIKPVRVDHVAVFTNRVQFLNHHKRIAKKKA